MNRSTTVRIPRWGSLIGVVFGVAASVPAMTGSTGTCIALPGGIAAFYSGDLQPGGWEPGSRGVVLFTVVNGVFYGLLAWGATRLAVHRIGRRAPTQEGGRDCPVCGNSLVGNVTGRCPKCKTDVVGLVPEDEYLCMRCGYNLTGNESGACPECGARPGVDDE